MAHRIREVLGWYGVVAIFLAYGLNTLHVIESADAIFLWLNLTGSAGIVIEAWGKRDFQPLTLNILWLIVAAAGLIQHLT